MPTRPRAARAGPNLRHTATEHSRCHSASPNSPVRASASPRLCRAAAWSPGGQDESGQPGRLPRRHARLVVAGEGQQDGRPSLKRPGRGDHVLGRCGVFEGPFVVQVRHRTAARPGHREVRHAQGLRVAQPFGQLQTGGGGRPGRHRPAEHGQHMRSAGQPVDDIRMVPVRRGVWARDVWIRCVRVRCVTAAGNPAVECLERCFEVAGQVVQGGDPSGQAGRPAAELGSGHQRSEGPTGPTQVAHHPQRIGVRAPRGPRTGPPDRARPGRRRGRRSGGHPRGGACRLPAGRRAVRPRPDHRRRRGPERPAASRGGPRARGPGRPRHRAPAVRWSSLGEPARWRAP